MHERCERKLQKTKYEHNAPEIRKWWLELFEILENDVSIGPEQRLSVLKEAIPPSILPKILSLMCIQMERYEVASVTENKPEFVRVSDKSTRSTSSWTLGTSSASGFNPYLDFFRRPPNRAAIWKELRPLALEQMNLNQIAQAVSEGIAKDFMSWLASVGGEKASIVNVQNIIDMFEVGSRLNCATTLCVNLKEMPSVPLRVAEAMDEKTVYKRNVLHREIKKDQKASMRKPRIVAFGRRLPTELQIKPPPKHAHKKWMNYETVPPRLETMAAVWQGITHLRSTKAFCEYLYQEHEEIKPPKFLVDSGMMDPMRKVRSRVSIFKPSKSFVGTSGFTLFYLSPLTRINKPRYPDPDVCETVSSGPSTTSPTQLTNIAMAIDPTYSRRGYRGSSSYDTASSTVTTSTSSSSPGILPPPDIAEQDDDSPVPPYMPIQGQRRTSSLEKKQKKKNKDGGCKQQ
ncbi:hypothetical protein JTB14_008350 [Gonioctena quinquepunctata]|nr:hypothetical protein JTB14_008350 [Gonioctena quinquepunctata]